MIRMPITSKSISKFVAIGFSTIAIVLFACNKEKPAVPKEQETVPEASAAPINYLALPNENWTDRSKERLQYIRELGDNKKAILSIAVDGTDQRMVVTPGFLDSSGLVSMSDTPRRSPDWRYVAVAGTDKEDGCAVAVLDLKTRTGKVVCGNVASEPAWSMDGTSLFLFYNGMGVAYRMATGKLDTLRGDHPTKTGQLSFATKPLIFGFTDIGYVISDYGAKIKRKADIVSKLRKNVEMSNIGALSWDGNYLANRFSNEVIIVDLSHADSIVFRDSLPEREMSLNSNGKTIYYVNSKTLTLLGLDWKSGLEKNISADDLEYISGLTTLFQETLQGKK